MDSPLAKAFDESLVEIYIVDLETRNFLYANKVAQRNLGYSLEELLVSTPELVSPTKSLSDYRDILEPALSKPQQEPLVVSNTHRRKDGSEYPVDAYMQFTTYMGRPAFIGFVIDATEKQKELDQLRSVIKGASLGYWDYNDATGEYFVDDNWLKMLGLEAGDVDLSEPNDWQRLIHPEDRDKLMNAVNTALAAQQAFTLEFRMLHKDGHVVWIQSCGAVVE